MLLATTQVEDFDNFLEIFSTKGAEKRQQHGSKGALIFRDPSEADRVWVVFGEDVLPRLGRGPPRRGLVVRICVGGRSHD
jgi:hypothetical protein